MGVTGIGGLFFRTRDPGALAEWYARHLGIDADEQGIWSQQAGPTVFAPFPADSNYFAADRQWMLNLRVERLDELAARLLAAGIAVERRAEWDMPGVGRFARIHDPEGNPIELWEPDAA
ncbi:MAG TPA: VOC family protein [Sphingomonas sp.]|nr:VOC family protein [Sphingomonas sp.]